MIFPFHHIMALSLLASGGLYAQETSAPAGSGSSVLSVRAVKEIRNDMNLDESKVPSYTLPDLLLDSSGASISSAEAWEKRGKPRWMTLFEEHMYGEIPTKKVELQIEERERPTPAYDNQCLRRQIRVTLRRNGRSLPIDLLIFTPKSASLTRPVPAFMGLNFQGNHSLSEDPGVFLSENWVRDGYPGVVNNLPTEASRGHAKRRWPVAEITRRGYALVTAHYGDIDPDFDDGNANGAHALFSDLPGQKPMPERAGNAWGAIGAWAWGLSRMLDAVERDIPEIDAARVAVIGHSRLGKTSLWAGANDPRFALVISNNSGFGGAALSKRLYGETVELLTVVRPHWFCGNFARYSRNERELPVDQHALIALMAPRPVYVGSASEDHGADPLGEFLSLQAAAPVFAWYIPDPLGGLEQHPAPGEGGGNLLGYHLREGKHDQTAWDWGRYLDFADTHLKLPTGE